MASSLQTSLLSLGTEVKQPTKAHLAASQKLLVESLYNLDPLLDCVLSASLLSQDNYHEIKAERTPQNRARKLLEIVQAQMDDTEATHFLECLRECKQHYPRLRNWLSPKTDIPSGPTERQLQANFYSLCGCLSSSVLPIALALFSSSTLTQFELERVQAAPTPTQQTQTLLTICLTKGENACRSFYEALYNEDQQLAEDMNVASLVKDLSLISESKTCSVAIAVEETRTTAGHLPYSGLLRQVSELMGVPVGDEARLNVCELGLALGLPRQMVRECLLEGVSIEDTFQLEAVVSLFMEKTQDADRLLSRMKHMGIQRFQLSVRGCLSLKLLQEAEAILRSGSHSHSHTWDHLHDQDHLHGTDHLHMGDCREQCQVWAIFSFLLQDCLAEALEVSDPKTSGSKGHSLTGVLQNLQGSERVEMALLQELEQCWKEGGAENLLQSIRVLAQILRDLHPFQNNLKLSGPSADGLYTCKSCRIQRVTFFQGISARVIRKVLNSVVPSSLQQDLQPRAQQYRDMCLLVAQLLNTIQPERGTSDLTDAPISKITQHICLALSQPAFSSQAFDAGIRHRLLSLIEFNPVQLCLGPLMQLHQETLSDLQRYLQPGEHHGFRFDLQSVQMQGQSRLLSVNSVRGPVAIDNGMEEDIRFVTSEETSFLVRIRCLGYDEAKGHFEVSEPVCFSTSRLGEEGQYAIRCLEGEVLAQEENTMWIREGGSRWREDLQTVAQRHSIQLYNEGCLFKVTSSVTECEVKFIYRGRRLWATAQRGCKVL
ncbi:uncharacterized protein [Hoplias malabaricus]|uniref:uncharacterized protein n=1 Tax=Hoplias malabaricus TaxID=27720 RepID=UPI003462DB7D